jgi:hypothetical protein
MPITRIDGPALGDALTGIVTLGGTDASPYGGRLNVTNSGQASAFFWNLGIGSGHVGFAAASSNLKLYNTYNDGLLANGLGIDIDIAGRALNSNQTAFMQVTLTGYNSQGFLSGTGSTYNLNRGNGYNATTGRFTAPVAGTYLLTCGILVETGTGRLEGNISINGSARINFNGTGTTYDGPTGILVTFMNAGDFARVNRQSGTAHSNGAHPQTYFGGYLLG